MRKPSSSASLHRSAMECTQEAVLAEDPKQARELFCSALELERRAAEIWEETRNEEPTRSILYRSAASLAWSCQSYSEAERLARKGLEGKPPGTVAHELEELLGMLDGLRRHQRRAYTFSVWMSHETNF